jgi:3-oxoacyl-[acyl-carrier-protein] synthase II
MAARRVVITGLGPVSPIGIGFAAFRASLLSERSGVHELRLFDASALPVRFGGEIEEFDAREFVDKKDRKQLKLMVRTIQLAVAAARLASMDAGLTPGAVDPERLGVILGTGIIPGDLNDLGPAAYASLSEEGMGIDLARWGREGLDLIPPMWMLNHVPNMPACHIAILHDARGPTNTIVQHDAAALMALIEAWRILQRGAADVLFAGGTDTRTNQSSIVRGLLYGRLSRRNDDPAGACRPYGTTRDGQVMGEGAGVLVLEEREHALRRGARIYGELLGAGLAFDRFGNEGFHRAITAALGEARVAPESIDHLNTAAGGAADDCSEAQVLAHQFPGIPVLAPKGYFGNLGHAASAVELMASLAEPGDPRVPASYNAQYTDLEFRLPVIQELRTIRNEHILKVAHTDRGQSAALLIRRES